MANNNNKKSTKKRSKGWKKMKQMGFNTTKVSQGKPNDVQWYAKNPLLLKLTGIVNFFNAVGYAVKIIANGLVNQFTWSSLGIFKGMYKRMPGVCRLSWIPTPGLAVDGTSPINKCMAKMFMKMRLQNMSLSAYDPADVAFYLLAWDSVYSMYALLTLIVAHAKEYKFTNQYYPKAILKALHVDANDIIDNLAYFTEYINVCKHAIEKSRVPKSLSYTARHMHMSAQVYRDSESEKAQLYVFLPDYLYKYDATNPALVPVPIGSAANELTFNDLKTIMNDMLDRLIPDEDMGIIAADIEKFVGGDCYQVSDVDSFATLEPVYNKEMLWQIHNSNFLPYSSVQGNSITQKVTANMDTIVEWNPTFYVASGMIGAKRVLDSNSEVPSPEEVIESTRLMFSVKQMTQLAEFNYSIKLDSCGSEILTVVQLICYDDDSNLQVLPMTTFVNSLLQNHSTYGKLISFPLVNDSAGNVILGTDLSSVLYLSQFEYHPIMYFSTSTGTTTPPCFIGFGAQLDNYAIIENEQLFVINEQCLLSEFDL